MFTPAGYMTDEQIQRGYGYLFTLQQLQFKWRQEGLSGSEISEKTKEWSSTLTLEEQYAMQAATMLKYGILS